MIPSYHCRRGAVMLAALGLLASAAAHAGVSATAEVTSFSYQVFSLGASDGTPPTVTFGNGGAQLYGSIRSEGDDGLFWTPSIALDSANHQIEAQTNGNGPFTFAQDASGSSSRDFGHSSGFIDSGRPAGFKSTLSLEDGSPPAGHDFLKTTGHQSVDAWTSVTLSPHSYVRFDAASSVQVKVIEPVGVAPDQFSVWSVASVVLDVSGPGSMGFGNQQGSRNILVSSNPNPESSGLNTWTQTLTNHLYNNTDAPLTGMVSLRLGGFADMSQPAAVPEPQSLALMLAGLAVAGTVLRRRGRRAAHAGAATGLSLALGAGLGLGAMGDATAAPKVEASIGFTNIQFNVFDLDPADGISPSLILPPPGSFGNSITSYVRSSDWGGGEPVENVVETLPLPDGGLFGIQPIYASAGKNVVTLNNSEDPQGASIVLRATAISDKPGNAGYVNTYLSLWPGIGEGSPHFSFTLGARSYVVLSMQVDVHAERTGIVGFEQNAAASGYWELSLINGEDTGVPTQRTSDEYRFDMYGEDQFKLDDSRTVSYAFYNPEDTAVTGRLGLRAGINASAFSSPMAVVPEADSIVLTLSGLVAVGMASRRHKVRQKGRFI